MFISFYGSADYSLHLATPAACVSESNRLAESLHEDPAQHIRSATEPMLTELSR